ncbi:Outer membrane receptor proteins, mostly Fe transport [Sphingobium sp. YR768]|nr:Outer membrane receptor proteins, mostly Fe transport [Sphingobium sp. YR768]
MGMIRTGSMAYGIGASLIALVAGTGTASAQAADPQAGGGGNNYADIIVTANKREQSLSDVGISITAETGDTLLQRGINSPTDLGKIVPGLTVQPSPFNTPVYTLRGVGFYETTLSAAPTVAVYTDEVALPFSAPTRGAAFDIERVEVLKGPQGTLFGQNTTGGAINYIVAKPTDDFKAGATASFGRFSTYDVQGYVSGPMSNTLKARVAIRTIQSGPWQKSFTRSDELGKQDMLQGRVLLDWQPSDKVKFLLNLNGWRDKGDTQAAQIVSDNCAGSVEGTCGSPDATNFKNYPRSPRTPRAADWGYGIFGRRPARDDSFWQASLRADFELNDNLTFTSISAYSHYQTDSVQDFDGTTYASVDTNTTGYIKDVAQELRLTGEFDSLTFIVGGNYNKSKTYDRLFYNFSEGPSSNPLWMIPGAPRGILTFNYSRQDVKNLAAFANAEYKVTPNITLIGGIRYTDSKRSFEGCTNDFGGDTATWWNAIFGTNVQPGGCLTFTPNFPDIFDPAAFDNLNEDNVSWNVGANYKTNGGTLFYTRVARGYKSGSFPTASVASYSGYVPVKQESVTAYEVGIKGPLADRRIEYALAGFYYDYKDKQLRGRKPDPVFGTLDGLVQIPKSRIWGVEASIVGRPVDGLRISLGGTYINTKITEFEGYDAFGDLRNFSGQKFPYAPKLTAVADAEYQAPISSSAEGYIGISLTYNSKTTTALANTTTAFVDADPRFDMRAYALVDLRAGFEFPDSNVRAGIYIRNVGNTYYWTNVQDNLASISRFAGMPRTYGVQVSWHM